MSGVLKQNGFWGKGGGIHSLLPSSVQLHQVGQKVLPPPGTTQFILPLLNELCTALRKEELQVPQELFLSENEVHRNLCLVAILLEITTTVVPPQSNKRRCLNSEHTMNSALIGLKQYTCLLPRFCPFVCVCVC